MWLSPLLFYFFLPILITSLLWPVQRQRYSFPSYCSVLALAMHSFFLIFCHLSTTIRRFPVKHYLVIKSFYFLHLCNLCTISNMCTVYGNLARHDWWFNYILKHFRDQHIVFVHYLEVKVGDASFDFVYLYLYFLVGYWSYSQYIN